MENDKNIWIIGAIIILLLIFGGFGMGGYGIMGFAGFGLLFMLLFWGGIIWLVFTLVNASQSNSNSDSLTILKRRYAKGEITKKQFEKIKKELE